MVRENFIMAKSKKQKQNGKSKSKMQKGGKATKAIKTQSSKIPKKVGSSKNASGTRSSSSSTGGMSDLQLNMQKRIAGSKFRMLNQQLYTTEGKCSFTEFQQHPDLFDMVSFAVMKKSIASKKIV